MPQTNGLTLKQKRFIEEYLIDLNASAAAIRVGYSKKTAAEIGYENLRKPQIHTAISRAQHARSARTQIGQDHVIQELARRAFANITQVCRWDNTGIAVFPSEEVPLAVRTAIRKIRIGTDAKGHTIVSVQMHNTSRAFEKLGRHLKLW